jgi:hypothetical protein
MSESTSTTLEDRVTHEDGVPAPSRGASGAILFPELVRAHYEWQHRTGQGPRARRGRNVRDHDAALARREDGRRDGRELEQAYRKKVKEFQAAEGEILDAYWCWNEASAVALTAKRKKRTAIRRGAAQLRLHRATDWATIKMPEIAELLHHYDSLGIRVSEILTPAPKRIAMERIFAEQSYLLGFVETTKGKPSESQLRTLLEKQRAALKHIEDYYDRAGENAARIYYFFGMMVGVLLLAGVATATTVPLVVSAGVDLGEMRDYLASYAAGAIGAVVSVMSRMRQDTATQQGFRVDYEVGKGPLWFLGGVRPLLGAIFGTATYFALQSSLVQMSPQAPDKAFYFFALLAFLSGFSERFTHVIFGQAEKTVTATLSEDEARDSSDSGRSNWAGDKSQRILEETKRKGHGRFPAESGSKRESERQAGDY